MNDTTSHNKCEEEEDPRSSSYPPFTPQLTQIIFILISFIESLTNEKDNYGSSDSLIRDVV